ncbi:MAG: cytochrome c biogenesis protein ResB [Verrucomicrobiae bacterium]|nr:cytochrome c biogenesis protein ResB [Verrucomicrobiae bacterium]
MLTKILDWLSSMRLTVWCLCAAMVLVFIGTLAQVEHGLYRAQKEYFQSFIVFSSLTVHFFGKKFILPVIFPGGYLIGGVLVLNLIFSQFRAGNIVPRKIGLYLVHGGLILLLLGQLVTDMFQRETHMRLVEGQASNYSESAFYHELAVIDTSHPQHDTVVAIPEQLLATRSHIAHPALPFTIQVRKFFPNSRLENRPPNETNEPAATQGFGRTLVVREVPLATRSDEKNLPSAIIELSGEGVPKGTWLVSTLLSEAQTFTHGNKQWQLIFRPVRVYKPFSIELIKFTHEKYPGTEIPKNFASRVRVINHQTGENREVLIYMNNPLRYGGQTFYQGSYDPNDPRVSILQVVRNPGWLTPYIACLLVGIGLTLHFILTLMNFTRAQGKGGAQ